MTYIELKAIIDNDMVPKLVAKAKEMLKDYDGSGIDTWDAVMINDTDGYDINVYQEGADEPLFVILYEVKDLNIMYGNEMDITQEVLA